MSFSSVSPVPRNLPVYFWFSLNLKDRIEAMGEVTWTDLSRTIGGLRFTQLSQANRELIQKWVSRLRQEEPSKETEVVDEEILEPGEEALVPQLVAVGVPEPNRTSQPSFPVRAKEPDRIAQWLDVTTWYQPERYVHVPEERTGLMFVFRVFDRVSYAVVLNTTDAINLGDWVREP